MIRLSREIRFSLIPPAEDGRVGNSWAGWPSTNQIVPFLVLRCELSGSVDQRTGYVCNIKHIDDRLREVITKTVIPEFQAGQTAEQLVRRIHTAVTHAEPFGARIDTLHLAVSPFLHYSISSGNPEMIQLTQQFEFSAAHRLHCRDLSDDENQKTFGKCNNPEGHGHNYVVEVTVARKVDGAASVMPLAELEQTVKQSVINRLDHKHLNRDVPYFADIIPSVENIAVAIWKWLEPELGQAPLTSVRVYETPKTWAEYRGD